MDQACGTLDLVLWTSTLNLAALEWCFGLGSYSFVPSVLPFRGLSLLLPLSGGTRAALGQGNRGWRGRGWGHLLLTLHMTWGCHRLLTVCLQGRDYTLGDFLVQQQSLCGAPGLTCSEAVTEIKGDEVPVTVMGTQCSAVLSSLPFACPLLSVRLPLPREAGPCPVPREWEQVELHSVDLASSPCC